MRYEYTLPDGVGTGEIADALRRRFAFTDHGGQRWEVCYFDTFDWRLFARGYLLEEHRSGSSRHLHWRALHNGAPDRVLPNARMPHFAHELPAGPFRDRLASVTEPRALLPQAIVHTHSHALDLENGDGKTLLRVILETGRPLTCEGGAAPVVSRRLRLQPLKGYEKQCRSVRRAVESLGLEPASHDLLIDLLSLSGRAPGGPSGRPKVSLDAGQRTDEAVKALLRALTFVLEANLPGVRARTDLEFLHDFRTAVRRARALLGELDGVFPKRVLDRFRRDLKWLGEITGDARDLDVLMLSFDDYGAMLSGDEREALEPGREFVARELEAAYQQLDHRLASVRFTRLLGGLKEFADAPSPRRTPLPHAMLPVKDFADRRLHRRFRKLRKAAAGLRGDDSAAVLHRCRILAKRARYLLDGFASLYPRSRVRELRARLRALQDALGDHHDIHVHRDALRDLRERMLLEDALSADMARAIEQLDERLAEREVGRAGHAADLLADFAGRETARACRRLIGAR
jgi:CHAD domain-containing protein